MREEKRMLEFEWFKFKRHTFIPHASSLIPHCGGELMMSVAIGHERGARYRSSSDVERLVREFETCRLARSEWTHQAHLTVALWYLVRYPERDATIRIRRGIKRYNRAWGIKTTRTGGYHETITRFYIRVISLFLKGANLDCTLAVLANDLIEQCGDKDLPLTYYSRERLMSWEARTTWVEPDLKSLG